jgi:ethanolamine utilization microcompartment shell protein EutS
LVENGIGIVSMAIVDLIGVVGDITKTKNAVRALDIWHRSSDGVVGLSDHIHGGIVICGSKEVGEVRFGQVLSAVGANKGVKVPRLCVGPVVQILLEE